jgi:WhiB family transcriptional regulator, redox-sensing transcriptional regulator
MIGLSNMKNWRKRGACRDADPTIFFPISYDGSGAETVAAAKAVCHSCRVLPQCTIAAILKRPTVGIWAGMTPDEISEEAERRRRRG